jgi:hypothetical protein
LTGHIGQTVREVTMYCTVQDVAAPIELYDGMHRAITARSGDRDVGLLLHLARPTAGGFQIIEIWRSEEECRTFVREIIDPLMAEMFGDQPPDPPAPTTFEPRGLVLPAAGIYS